MEESETYPHNSEDVREQLEQQRTLAAQLREKLEQDEMQLASKEQQNELLKSKLSLLKSRSKAKRTAVATDKEEGKIKSTRDLGGNSPKHSDSKLSSRKQGSSSANKGKINILREQLEQNRLRFERHGLELTEDTRSMEAMVEQLRHKLEERDVTIQQLQEGQLPSIPSVPHELTPEPVDIGAQLLQKEKEVFNLSAQVSDLQNVILELQENLKEKDCVIEARTQAISLLSEDMSKKWRANVDMLEETRQQMHLMQENFIRIEAGLNLEIEQLHHQIESSAQKLAQTEQNVKTAEADRITLAAQNAELLSELNNLKETQKASSGLEEAKLKIDELSQAVTEANKLTIKLKAEHKAKVKALNKQIDSLRKESDLSSEVVQLQNHIAELEEEKGNMQLHLIEVEENTVTQRQTIKTLQESMLELQNQKIAAEKRLELLEEQLASNEKSEQQILELKMKLEDREKEIYILEERLRSAELAQGIETLADLQKELHDVQSSAKEWQCRYEKLEKQVEEKKDNSFPQVCATVDMNVDQPQSSVHNVDDSSEAIPPAESAVYPDDLMQRVTLLENSMCEKQIEVQELEAIVRDSLTKISEFSATVSSDKTCVKCEGLRQELLEKELQISVLESSVVELKKDFENLKSIEAAKWAESEQSNRGMPSSPLDLVNNVSDIERELIEVSGELELKREECARLETKLKAQVDKTKKLAVKLKVKNVALKEFEERVNKYEGAVQNNKVEIEKMMIEKQDILEKWQLENLEKDAALSQVRENLLMKESDIHSLKQEVDNKSATIAELEFRLAAMGQQVQGLQLEVEEKFTMIENLNQHIAEHGHQIESQKVDELLAQLAISHGQLATECEEKQAAVSKLENLTKQAKLKLAKEKKVRSDMLEKQNELEALLKEKENALLSLQEQQATLTEHFQQEKTRFETLLKEHQEQTSVLHQQLELERSKLQYASESVSTEEPLEITLELQPSLSYENFQNEVEDICIAVNASCPQNVLPTLEEEKVKTMQELNLSFESLHDQFVARLQNRSDIHADRKLFVELKNLVTRVINRTAALEHKIKKIVAESNSVIQKRLCDAERSVLSLETSLSEARAYLDVKESEKLNLEDTVNNLSREKWDLNQNLQEEKHKSHHLETKIKEMQDQTDVLIQTTENMKEIMSEKDKTITDLQVSSQMALTQSNEAQENLEKMYQQNCDLQLTLDRLTEDCEKWKRNSLNAEQEINNNAVRISELKTCCDDATGRYEALQEQMNAVVQERDAIVSQLEVSTQKIEELNLKLSEALNSSALLQEEIYFKSNDHIQLCASLTSEKEQFEKKVLELTEQLRTLEQAAKNSNPICIDDQPDNVESLRQQLAEKEEELGNYQRRLIQLQMGGSNSTISSFDFPGLNTQAFEVPQPLEQTRLEEGVVLTEDAFKPAASLFETPAECKNLQSEIQSLTEQLSLLTSEKYTLESERMVLKAKTESLDEELNNARKELETLHSTVNVLQQKVSELNGALQASKANVEQERINAAKLEGDVKALQWKLETEGYEKEKVESELKARIMKDAEDRPSIPQTLDTHVSSLQNSGVDFRHERKENAFEETKEDESLMESNITQLESELGGMVMSQQDNSQKQTDNMRLSEIKQLKKKISQLEADKSIAQSQVDDLQTEIKKLTQSTPETTGTVTNQGSLSASDGDALVNDDDSWEWGTDSVHLEVQHQEQKSQAQILSSSSLDELQGKIDLLKSENETLQKEKIQLSEDLKASQIRAAKLTRKLKEIKAKYDEISDKSRSTDSPFDSLDQTIEEERMKQMQSLEKELKELQTEVCTLKADREKLQKQVDVFSSANDRMVEAKERQDVEVEMWQKRSKDLTNQVQSLEWRIRELEDGQDGKPSHSAENSGTCEQPVHPPETLNAVEIDQLLKENHTWNTNYENLMQEYQKLRAQCLVDGEQRTQIDALVMQQKSIIERLEHEKTYLQDVYDALKLDYESVCAQLASKQTSLNEHTHVDPQKAELEEKLNTAEKQLQETVAQLHVVSLDNAELLDKCSNQNEAWNDLVLKLEESHRKVEADALEIARLQEAVRMVNEKSSHQVSSVENASTFIPVREEFVSEQAPVQGTAPNDTVLNWSSMVPSDRQSSGDIFESIASNTTQGLEEQLIFKENELQKEKRMIETLKRTMQESELEWGQLIEYHKSQLEAAQIKICELQGTLELLKSNSNTGAGVVDPTSDCNNQIERCHELQNIIFSKEKEIESLQINLALSEEAKRKLEETLHFKEAQIDKMLKELPAVSVENSSQGRQPSLPDQSVSNLSSSSASSPVIGASDKNLSNELDQALYMLHERDVRCEELTLELTQLLEERDGLQLRLSNAIRTNEELREQLRQALLIDPANSLDQDHFVSSMVPESFNARPPIPQATEGHSIDLQTKLTELRTIGYSHDKRLRDDSEYRHQQQMRLMSPSPPTILLSGDPNEIANPSDVASFSAIPDLSSSSNNDLSTADQSISNESQGSLLGWLWGRS